MSRNAVRLYVAALAATATPTMVIWDHIPKGADNEDSMVIRRMTDVEERSTMAAVTMGPPRNRGQKLITHTVEAELLTVDPDEQETAYQIDRMVQGLKTVLRATALPVALTDVATGEVSEVIGIGEDIAILENWSSQLTEESIEGDAWESVVVAITVKEMVQG